MTMVDSTPVARSLLLTDGANWRISRPDALF